MSTATVQSIDRAFEILEALGNCPNGMQVKELSAALALNKSTVSRILLTLASKGYVVKNKDNYYRLGDVYKRQVSASMRWMRLITARYLK